MKYHLARGEEQLGTFNDLDVSAGLRDGRFKPTDLCWTEGMAEWLPLRTHLHELNVDAAVPAAVASEPPGLSALREEVRQDQGVRLELATRGQRFAAKLIDMLMLIVPFVIYYTIVFDPALQEELQALQKDPAGMVNVIQRRIDTLHAGGNLTPAIMGMILNLVVLVNVVLLTIRGQTLGKLFLGIQVVRFPGGARAGFIKAVLLRDLFFGLIIFGSSLFFGAMGMALLVGNAMMVFRQDRRCMHDLIADTVVTKRSR